jgi:predicted metal-dependent RNase
VPIHDDEVKEGGKFEISYGGGNYRTSAPKRILLKDGNYCTSASKVLKGWPNSLCSCLQEEALRVESIMQQLAIEQVKEERLEGEKRLAAAVNATQERCHQELLTAVAAVRAEEKDIAAKEAARKAK